MALTEAQQVRRLNASRQIGEVISSLQSAQRKWEEAADAAHSLNVSYWNEGSLPLIANAVRDSSSEMNRKARPTAGAGMTETIRRMQLVQEAVQRCPNADVRDGAGAFPPDVKRH